MDANKGSMRILVIEDDEMVSGGICKWLNKEVIPLIGLQDGLAGRQALQTELFDIIVLDIGLQR